MNIYDKILANKAKGQKMFALLIDPEKCSDEWLRHILSTLNNNSQISNLNSQFIFVGGSQLKKSVFDVVEKIKALTSASFCVIRPIVLF